MDQTQLTVKNLTNDEFNRLVKIVADYPAFETVDGRVALVDRVLRGVEGGERVRRQLRLDGQTQVVASSLVAALMQFGRISPDREALGLLIAFLLEEIGSFGEDSEFLQTINDAYNLSRPVILSNPIDDWRGAESPESVAEKIIGENTLRDVRLLSLALRAADAVVRVQPPDGFGSGFVVGDGLVFTNNHIIPDAEAARGSQFDFWYELGIDNLERKMVSVGMKPDGAFYTNLELDFTLVELASVPDGVEALAIRPKPLAVKNRVSIIQHPAGHYKQISMQNNFVEFANATVVQYTTSTMPGSSGSPVFDDEFAVVGIHHSGGRLRDPETGQRYLRNAGTSMNAILGDLQANAPELFERIRPK